jgi:hypothetical protein
MNVYGESSLPHIDNLGRFIVVRLKKLYQKFGGIGGNSSHIFN